MGLSYKTKNNPASQHPLAMIAEHGSVNIDDMINVRPGMMIPYTGNAPQAVSALPDDKWDEVLASKAQREAEHAAKWEVAHGVGSLDPYAGTRFSKVATETTADKLNAWYKRLEARVAEIEADDAVMGNREEAKWRAEMDAFKADLN